MSFSIFANTATLSSYLAHPTAILEDFITVLAVFAHYEGVHAHGCITGCLILSICTIILLLMYCYDFNMLMIKY